MNLIDIYSMLQRKEITIQDASKALEVTESNLKYRLTRWGNRLPLLLVTLDRIRNDGIPRSEAAANLGVSNRQVNALMNTWHVHRPLPTYLVERAASSVRWEIHKKYATDFIADSVTIEQAAESAHISPRQMRRKVSELLDKHFGMVFKDLEHLALHKRKRLADEIETAEGIEVVKAQVLKAIAEGKKSLHEEAFKRVIAKRSVRERYVRA